MIQVLKPKRTFPNGKFRLRFRLFKKYLTVGKTFDVTVAANDQREKAQLKQEPLLTVIKGTISRILIADSH